MWSKGFNRIRWTEVKLWRHWPSVVQSTIADGHPAPGSTLLIAHFTTSHGNVNIKYIRLDWFTRRPFFCFARFADSALEDYATRCLCHISSSRSDTATECQKYLQNSFCKVSLSLSWLFSTVLCRVCSRWTLDRQSKSRRDNSSRLASCLLQCSTLQEEVSQTKEGNLPDFLQSDAFCSGDSQTTDFLTQTLSQKRDNKSKLKPAQIEWRGNIWDHNW